MNKLVYEWMNELVMNEWINNWNEWTKEWMNYETKWLRN